MLNKPPPMWLWCLAALGFAWEMALLYYAINKPNHPITNFLFKYFRWMIIAVFMGLMYIFYAVSQGRFQ